MVVVELLMAILVLLLLIHGRVKMDLQEIQEMLVYQVIMDPLEMLLHWAIS